VSGTSTRVLSALALIPALLALIWWAPDWLFRAIVTAALAIAAIELSQLVRDWAARIALLVVYLAFPLLMLAEMRTKYGPGALMVLIGAIIISDSAQYFCGRAFGRRKLAPVISPKKTVEGAVGGVAIAAAATAGLAWMWLPSLPPVVAVGAGLAMALAGIVGDLFESALKRRAGVKDSGHLIPGHGGILDRIDSWLFAAPVFWVFLAVWA
jgi:phosphatidate cytidylyltransferase